MAHRAAESAAAARAAESASTGMFSSWAGCHASGQPAIACAALDASREREPLPRQVERDDVLAPPR